MALFRMLGVMLAFYALLQSPAYAAPPMAGQGLPSFMLSAPQAPDQRKYLGLDTDTKEFKPTSIKALLVIIEVFSMYCPWCQKEAPEVNRLYQAIEENPKSRGLVKIIGIGAGNSAFEVEYFAKTYSVPFPLFPDIELSIHKLLGEPNTPFFIVVKLDGQSGRIIYSKLGSIRSAEAFLSEILRKAGLQ